MRANRRGLLLNSRSTLFPDGLANSSGAVGRNLMDSVGSEGVGYFPQLERIPPHNHDGVGGMHMYVPWWKFDRKNDFLRGYHIEFGGGRGHAGRGQVPRSLRGHEGYGARSEAELARSKYGTYIGFAGRGEMIPNRELLLRDRSGRRRSVGHPGAALPLKWSDNEIKMAKDMQETFEPSLKLRAEPYLGSTREDAAHPYGIADGGVIIHELGTVRMGETATSVLNSTARRTT